MHPRACARRRRTADRSPASRTVARRRRRATTVARSSPSSVAKHDLRGPVDRRVARAGSACTSAAPGSPTHDTAKPVTHVLDQLAVRVGASRAARSCPGSRRAGNECRRLSCAARIRARPARSDDPREVVVRERGVAHRRGEEKDVRPSLPSSTHLAVRDVPVRRASRRSLLGTRPRPGRPRRAGSCRSPSARPSTRCGTARRRGRAGR